MKLHLHRIMALLLLVACSFRLCAADEDRVAMPPAADIEKAHKLVRDLFKDDFTKTTPKARLALAEKLYKQAEDTTDDNAAQFALFRDAAELAAAGGDGELALRSVDRIRNRFSGVPPELVEVLLKTLTTKAATADANLALANYLIKVTDEAVAADELDAAERLAKLADSAAAKSKHVRTAAVAAGRVKEVDAFKKDSPKVKEALKTLETKPADPGASVVAGKFYCFQKGEWEKGIPLLAAGDDAKLKTVAEKEIAADAKDSGDLMGVADGWYELAAPLPAGPVKRGAQSRAYTFYAKAVTDLTGLSKTRTEKRLEELEKVVEVRGYDELASLLRTAVRNKDVEELRPVGGAFGDKDFKEMAPPGGILIGFNYGIRKAFNRDVVAFMQPIYMTPTGEKLGASIGKAQPKPLTVKAKPGYAVGALHVRPGIGVDGFLVTFARIQGKSLSATDKYDSPWAGQAADRRDANVGDGRPVVGVHGKREGGNEDIVIHLGFIVTGAKPKK